MPELRIGSRRVGYVRVSTDVQNTARQLDAEDLASQGIVLDMIFTDRCSGKDTKRPELQRCLDFLRGGDTLYVHSIDRLARNLADLQRIVENLNSKDLDTVGAGVTVVFLKNGLTFSGAKTSPADRLMLQMLGAFAEFEREILKERQLEGIAKAKTAGKYTGKKSKLTVDDLDAMQALKDAGISVAEIGRRYGGMTRQGVYKALRRRKKTVPATEPEQVPSAVVPPVVGGEPVETVEQQLIVDTLPAVQDGPKCSAEALKVEPEISLPDVIVVQEPDTPSVRVPAETPSAQAEPDAGRQEDRVPEFVSDAMKTAELRAEAKAVPETPAQRTPEEYWSAVKAASSIDTIPEPETYDEALYAVRQRMALWHVPERLRTPELCAEAVRFNTESLQDVPEELKTVELCMEAIRNDPYALLFVPDRMKTETLCVECVRRNGLALAGVPVEWRTPELCAEAVRECAMALGYVPEALRTPEMCRYAVQNYGLTLKDVPKALLTTEMCRNAVQNTGMALMYVPEAFRKRSAAFRMYWIN